MPPVLRGRTGCPVNLKALFCMAHVDVSPRGATEVSQQVSRQDIPRTFCLTTTFSTVPATFPQLSDWYLSFFQLAQIQLPSIEFSQLPSEISLGVPSQPKAKICVFPRSRLVLRKTHGPNFSSCTKQTHMQGN